MWLLLLGDRFKVDSHNSTGRGCPVLPLQTRILKRFQGGLSCSAQLCFARPRARGFHTGSNGGSRIFFFSGGQQWKRNPFVNDLLTKGLFFKFQRYLMNGSRGGCELRVERRAIRQSGDGAVGFVSCPHLPVCSL